MYACSMCVSMYLFMFVVSVNAHARRRILMHENVYVFVQDEDEDDAEGGGDDAWKGRVATKTDVRGRICLFIHPSIHPSPPW